MAVGSTLAVGVALSVGTGVGLAVIVALRVAVATGVGVVLTVVVAVSVAVAVIGTVGVSVGVSVTNAPAVAVLVAVASLGVAVLVAVRGIVGVFDGAGVGVLDGANVGVLVRVTVSVGDVVGVTLLVGVAVKGKHWPLVPSQVAPKTTTQLPQPPVAGPHTSGPLHWQQSPAPGVRVGVGTTTTIAPLLPTTFGSDWPSGLFKSTALIVSGYSLAAALGAMFTLHV